MHLCMSVVVIFAIATTVASAETYWVEWTGDAYPETEGWIRYSSDPPAERWLEDGKLFIDSRADWFISEEYFLPRPGMMTPGPGESFVMQWRVMVHEIVGYSDPGVGVVSDDEHALVLSMGRDFIESAEEGTSAPFTPDEWHEFMLQSQDMLSYELYIDGALGFDGEFFDSPFSNPGVGWGDISSHRSLAEWDYVAFGIVPEPSSGLFILAGICAGALSRRWATRREPPIVEGSQR
jgi:hypothetical protein